MLLKYINKQSRFALNMSIWSYLVESYSRNVNFFDLVCIIIPITVAVDYGCYKLNKRVNEINSWQSMQNMVVSQRLNAFRKDLYEMRKELDNLRQQEPVAVEEQSTQTDVAPDTAT